MSEHSRIGEVTVEVDILAEDIDEMMYHLCKPSPSDLSVNNAVCFALYRLIRPGYQISVTTRQNEVTLQIGSHRFPLNKELSAWLASAAMGFRVKPVKSTLSLPEVLVRSAIATEWQRKELANFDREHLSHSEKHVILGA